MSPDIKDLTATPPSPGTATPERSVIARLKRRFLYGLIFGVAVIAVVTFAGNRPELAGTLSRFEWRLMPIIIGLTLANYLLRFGKWQFYLR